MYDIQISNEQRKLPLNEERIREIVVQVLQDEEVKGAEISVAIVDNPTIWRLNRRHLKHDYPTDVLSFLLDCDEQDSISESRRGAGKTLSGEVIVSAEMAMEMAENYAWNAQDELCLYLVHGLLHLCGYDDLSSDEQFTMRLRERAILQHWNLTPHYAEDSASLNSEGAS